MPPRKNPKNAAAHKKRTQRRTKSQDADDRGADKFVDLYDFAPIAYVSFDRPAELRKPIWPSPNCWGNRGIC